MYKRQIEKAKKESGPTPKDLVDACQELKEQGWIPDESQIMTVEDSLKKEEEKVEVESTPLFDDLTKPKPEVKAEITEAQVKDEEIEEVAEEVQQKLIEELKKEPEEMTREEQIKFLLKEIFRIRRERLLIIEEIDKQIADVMDKLRQARDNLMNSGTKLEVQKWMAYIKSLTSEKTALDSRRHLVRMLHKEEARLRLELAKLETGKE